MKIAVRVLAVLVLALLLAPSVQSQQTKPSAMAETEPSNQPFFQDDIHVKPRGTALVGADWACGGSLCVKGKRKKLRDDLFETLAYLDVGGRNLDGMKFTLKGLFGDLEISVEKEGNVFTWKAGDKLLKDAGYKACKHNDPNKTCRNSGIPGSWMDKLEQIWVKYEGNDQYEFLGEFQEVHLKGK
jgi:hypothetical protein